MSATAITPGRVEARVNAAVPRLLREEFERLAREHERSLSAELRVAMSRHLERSRFGEEN